MKHIRQRNMKIAEELILLAYRYGAKDINLSMKERENTTIISIHAYNVTMTKDTLEAIENLLKVPRCSEMEEYYWNLTGESDTDGELALIGVMTDSYDLSLMEDNTLKIELYRKN